MTETEIRIGPVRPQSGPLAKTGGAAISQLSGGGSLENRQRQSEQDIRALQDQILALSKLLDQQISVPMLIASGPNHQAGVVPDPGSTSGTTKFLREDATFAAVSATALVGVVPIANGGTGTASTLTGLVRGSASAMTAAELSGDVTTSGSNATTIANLAVTNAKIANSTIDLTAKVTGVLPVANGGTGTASGSITGTGALTFTSAGATTVALKPGTDSTTAVQLQNAAGTAIVNVDSTNSILSVGTVTPYAGANPAKFQVHNGTDQNLLFRAKINLGDGVALHSINDAYAASKGLELIGSAIYLNAALYQAALAGVPVYANNAAAITGGLGQGAWYRTGADPDFICIVH